MGMMLSIIVIVALCPLLSYGAEWLFRRLPVGSAAGNGSVPRRG
jgi:hypothetical protein